MLQSPNLLQLLHKFNCSGISGSQQAAALIARLLSGSTAREQNCKQVVVVEPTWAEVISQLELLNFLLLASEPNCKQATECSLRFLSSWLSNLKSFQQNLNSPLSSVISSKVFNQILIHPLISDFLQFNTTDRWPELICRKDNEKDKEEDNDNVMVEVFKKTVKIIGQNWSVSLCEQWPTKLTS